jgi:hypothetical protein
MKTAMQELKDNSLFTEGEEYIQIVLKKTEWIELLEKEKEQIIKAWEDGDYAYFYSKETGRDFDNGEDYFNEKYKK